MKESRLVIHNFINLKFQQNFNKGKSVKKLKRYREAIEMFDGVVIFFNQKKIYN